MAILLSARSRIIIQGITGYVGRNAAGRMLEAGTPLVGGVTPGRAGQEVGGVPVFESCAEAVAEVGANASLVLVPAPFCLDACLEAIEAGLELISIYTEGVPIGDAARIAAVARARGAVVLGPNSGGCVAPGIANVSDLNDAFLSPGPVDVVAKSAAITYEVADLLAAAGLGVSSVVCLGGDPLLCTYFREILERFEADAATEAVVMVGEIGGRSELDAAEVVRTMTKPVIAHVLGRHAPPGKRMGHAGALIGDDDENVPGKSAALGAAGALVADRFVDIADRVGHALETRRSCIPT
jgi:succinyl-CoA synthetase alpha subunit